MKTDADIQRLVAQSLERLGLPAQRFEIRAAYLEGSSLDLGVELIWPMTLERVPKPSGVIQIGAPKTRWRPQTVFVVYDARIMTPSRLQHELSDYLTRLAAAVRAETEAKGLRWPQGWPRFEPSVAHA